VPGAARAQIRALDELVLELPYIRVLRRELDLVGLAPDDLLDAVARFLERLVLWTAAELDDRCEGARDLGRRVGPRDIDGDALRLGVAKAGSLASVVVLQGKHEIRFLHFPRHLDGYAQLTGGLLQSIAAHAEREHAQALYRTGAAGSGCGSHRFTVEAGLGPLGRRLLESYPYVPVIGNVRISIAVFSYDGGLYVGVTGDYDSSSDVGVLTRGIERAMAELLELYLPRRPGTCAKRARSAPRAADGLGRPRPELRSV